MTARNALIVRGGWDGHQPVAATEVFLPFLERERLRHPDRGVARGLRRRRGDGGDRPHRAVGHHVGGHPRAGDGTARRGRGRHRTDGLARRDRRLVPRVIRLPAAGRRSVRHAPEPASPTCSSRARTRTTTSTTRSRSPTSGGGIRSPKASRTSSSPPSSTGCCTTISTTCSRRRHIRRSRGTRGIGPSPRPAVWTRLWGRGRIVVTTPGHTPDILEHPSVRTIIERGMLWATRTASAS